VVVHIEDEVLAHDGQADDGDISDRFHRLASRGFQVPGDGGFRWETITFWGWVRIFFFMGLGGKAKAP
jgi:hypothetical protein